MLSNTQFATLADMLTYCRPHGSVAEGDFIARYLTPLGVWEDAHHNLHLWIGTAPIIWSSHTDTVHRIDGRQTVKIDPHKGRISLSRRSRKRGSNCLGADDTVGVFLMIEMINAGVEGHYIFHYGEEVGGKGSGDLARHSPDLLKGARYAVALDRAGTKDVITFQGFGYCASDAFARSLAAQLPSGYRPDDGGVYTDTAEYVDSIPECTNISVGYYHQHSQAEYVDTHHVGALLEHLKRLDVALLVCERDPKAQDPRELKFSGFDYWTDKMYWSGKGSGRLADTIPPRSVYTRNISLHEEDWCGDCDAVILHPQDPARDLLGAEFCICDDDDRRHYRSVRDDDDLHPDDEIGLSADDRAFLSYLRNR